MEKYTMSQRFDAASFSLALMFFVIVLLAAPFVGSQ